jgi:putative ABC transport system ATP-binding protein
MEELNAKGLTLIMVTHDPELGQRAHRRIQMVDGRIMGDSRHDTTQ